MAAARNRRATKPDGHSARRKSATGSWRGDAARRLRTFIATLFIQQTGVLASPASYVMSAAALTLVFLLRIKAPDQATALDR